MADPDLVDVLRRGTETWNRFRVEHPESQSPNLSRAELQGLNLDGADLHGANLTGAIADVTLRRGCRAQLSQAKAPGPFRRAILNGQAHGCQPLPGVAHHADLTGADRRGFSWSRPACPGRIFRCQLQMANASRAVMDTQPSPT
jgi:uncharacterized protein YjbI with pentapeptide repeats